MLKRLTFYAVFNLEIYFFENLFLLLGRYVNSYEVVYPFGLKRKSNGCFIAVVTVNNTADYITGVMCAIADKKLSSSVGFKGICRKVLIFILIGIANALDIYVLDHAGVLRTAIIFFYISNEGLSLVENSAHLGLPVPDKLKDVLEQLHDRDGKESDKEDK